MSTAFLSRNDVEEITRYQKIFGSRKKIFFINLPLQNKVCYFETKNFLFRVCCVPTIVLKSLKFKIFSIYI